MKPKARGKGLELKTITSDDGRSFLVFRTGKGAYHVFMEMNGASVAKEAFSTTKGNTRAKWKKIWERV